MTRSLHPTEFQNQVVVMQWSRLAASQHPELALLYHVANGGSRHPAEAARLKAAGVKAGVPDLATRRRPGRLPRTAHRAEGTRRPHQPASGLVDRTPARGRLHGHGLLGRRRGHRND